MNLLFSDRAKKNIEEFSDVALMAVSASILVSFFSKHFWFFNLFDQLWLYYLLVSFLALGIYALLLRLIKAIVSLAVFIICLIIFSIHNSNYHNENVHKNLKIYYHNVNSANTSFEDLYSNINKVNADIIALVEASPAIDNFLKKTLKDFNYTYSIPRSDNFGFAIYSKKKFAIRQVYEKDATPLFLKIYFQDLNTAFYLVHLPPPLWSEAFEAQKETLSLIAQEISKNKTEAYLVLGDLNMTPESSTFQHFYKILKPKYNSWKTIHEGTWPSVLPKFFSLSIDHVMSDNKLGLEVDGSAGSDHRAILITI